MGGRDVHERSAHGGEKRADSTAEPETEFLSSTRVSNAINHGPIYPVPRVLVSCTEVFDPS